MKNILILEPYKFVSDMYKKGEITKEQSEVLLNYILKQQINNLIQEYLTNAFQKTLLKNKNKYGLFKS